MPASEAQASQRKLAASAAPADRRARRSSCPAARDRSLRAYAVGAAWHLPAGRRRRSPMPAAGCAQHAAAAQIPKPNLRQYTRRGAQNKECGTRRAAEIALP
eukprot:359540-Chlamydomonas_euryale.AAC.7